MQKDEETETKEQQEESIMAYVEAERDKVQPLAGDKFAGAGGLTAGLWEAQFGLGTTCERGMLQRRELRRRYGGQADPVKLFEDLEPAHFAGHYFVTSAAPCTPFSRAGRQRAHEDYRSTYYEAQAKALVAQRVPCCVFENVSEVEEQQAKDVHGNWTSPLEKLWKILEDA